MSALDPEERLNRLEETLFFQEQTIAELSHVLHAQQTSMDALERRLTEAEARVLSLARALFERQGGGNGEPELPPHYL